MLFIKNVLRKLYYINSFFRFKKVGKNIIFSKGGSFINPEQISFGSNIFISQGFKINAKSLTFGSNIMIGPNLVIESDNHKYDIVGKTMFSYSEVKVGSGISIEDDVWIGANVTILSNVVIGEGSVVGAGSVVTKNISPYTISFGNPCRPYKRRFSPTCLEKHIDIVGSRYTIKELEESFQKIF